LGVDRQIELARVHHDLAPRVVPDGVGRVRRERESDARRVIERVARGKSFRQVSVGVGRIRRRKVKNRHADQRAQAGAFIRVRSGVGIEIHIVCAGDAAFQHFRRGMQRAIGDEFRRYVAALRGPDVLFQPDL